PRQIAATLGVSPRYLHKLFAANGRSVARWLLTRRLEHCARDLTDPARAHWSISAIAVEHGFRDASYFARAFKAHYGVQPRAVRDRRLRR
ncbi:MAG: AraC family transcriptional regulator, partial [Conexibacter sp.]|nr:AraC family transcriptional regulator [Conexibacter sp.]